MESWIDAERHLQVTGEKAQVLQLWDESRNMFSRNTLSAAYHIIVRIQVRIRTE